MATKISDNVWVVGGKTADYFSKEKNITHTPNPIKKDSSDSGEWCNWGDDNLYPQRLMEKVKLSGTAQGGLDVLKSAHYGAGFRIHEAIETEKGVDFRERHLTSKNYPAIKTFFDETQFPIMMDDIVSDYEDFHLAFPEYLTTPNSQEIISVERKQSANCRFASFSKSG